MSTPTEPTRDAVKCVLHELISGTLSREAASDWASVWVVADDPGITDQAVWATIRELSGADLKVSPNEYLHTLDDFRRWLQNLDRAGLQSNEQV